MRDFARRILEGGNCFLFVKQGPIFFAVDDHLPKGFTSQDGVPQFLIEFLIMLTRFHQLWCLTQNFFLAIAC